MKRMKITLVTVFAALAVHAQGDDTYYGNGWDNSFSDNPFHFDELGESQYEEEPVVEQPRDPVTEPGEIALEAPGPSEVTPVTPPPPQVVVPSNPPPRNEEVRIPPTATSKYGIDMVHGKFCDPSFKFAPACEVMVAKSFYKPLKVDFKQCVMESSRAVGFGNPEQVTINHWGLYSNRNVAASGDRSLHASARALDIRSITLVVNGQKKKISMTSVVRNNSLNKRFYENVRKCWRNKNRSCHYSIGHSHSHTPRNSAHNDHLHISFGCPRKSGHAHY